MSNPLVDWLEADKEWTAFLEAHGYSRADRSEKENEIEAPIYDRWREARFRFVEAIMKPENAKLDLWQYAEKAGVIATGMGDLFRFLGNLEIEWQYLEDREGNRLIRENGITIIEV